MDQKGQGPDMLVVFLAREELLSKVGWYKISKVPVREEV